MTILKGSMAIVFIILIFKGIMSLRLVIFFKVFFALKVRDGPFNFQGRGYGFFLKKIILIPNVAEQNILILVEEKKII